MSLQSSGFSLVKYDTPVLVSKTFGKKAPTSGGNASAKTSASSLGTDSSKAEDYLNSILPPREYGDQGQLWVQYVSPIPATRLDVVTLQEELDKKLLERQVRETGICPIREELYSQALDELIRQITINCAERGFLLVRVRDEIKMTIQAYQTLYESSIAYGMRKALQDEQQRADKLLRQASLEKQNGELGEQLNELEQTILALLQEEEDSIKQAQEEHDTRQDIEQQEIKKLQKKLNELMDVQDS